MTPTLEVPEFVTVERIPVLEVGVSYPASTGPFTCTLEMLEEAVTYAEQDPHGYSPRIKIAHAENPIDDDLQALWEEVNGERDASKPSLGTILNLEIEDQMTLMGDWYGLPGWFAHIMETAYPARSIEGGHWRNPANDKEYAFMIEAVALLGVVGPGCTSMEDLQELFSKDGPQVTVIEMSRASKPKAEGGDPMGVIAQVNVEDIRRAFYDDFAQGDRYWWWDRELLIDPLEMIVQDPDEGQLYRLPITLKEGDGTESVEFGEPEPVKVQYVPDPSAKPQDPEAAAVRTIASQLKGAGKVLAMNTQPPRAKEREEKESQTMEKDTITAMRTRLGVGEDVLPDDATDEQIKAALEADPPKEDDDDKPDDEESDDEDNDDDDNDVEATRGVMVDKDALAKLQGDAEAGREARQTQLKAERKQFLDKAIKAGKFPPAAREAYEAQLAKGGEIEKSTKTFIDKLSENTVPVTEMGQAPADESHSSDAYDPSWLSKEERDRIKASQDGTERVTTEVS